MSGTPSVWFTHPITGVRQHVAISADTIIGRREEPETGVINLHSPRSAVSRNHALLRVAANGDAFIMDLGSTNGTVISFHPGPGTVLEPKVFYMLREGTRCVFGDVELVFDANVEVGASPKRQSLSSVRDDVPFLSSSAAKNVALPLENFQPPSLPSAANLCERGRDRDACDEKQLQYVPPLAQPAKKVPSKCKSSGVETDLATPKGEAPLKQHRTESKPSVKTERNAGPDHRRADRLVVTFTGVKTELKSKLSTLVTNNGGTVTDDFVAGETNIVVVGASTTYLTPKLLRAVAVGCDVVAPRFLESYGKRLGAVEEYCPVVEVEDGPVLTEVPAGIVRSAIDKWRSEGPALKGMRVVLDDDIGKERRQQVKQVVVAAGAVITRSRTAGAVTISDKDVGRVWEAIVRGRKYDARSTA